MTLLKEYFESPAMLVHLLLVAAVAGLWIVARRKRRRLLAAWFGILKQSDHQRRQWRLLIAIRAIGLSCLVISLAGPLGGETKSPTLAGQRDVMIVLDVSRSMLAEQPSRLDKAIRSLRTFTEGKRLPQGTRVGLVMFAAKPWLAFPLTADFEHLAATLDRLAAGEAPPDVRAKPDDFVSGTRLGAALKLAVESFPAANSNPCEIVLLSDGDDPEADDEWQLGLTVARTKGVPVNAIAVGEPGVAATIPDREGVLQFAGDVVKTEVQRARLDEIAQRTGGLSLTVERGDIPLASHLAKRWADAPSRTTESESTAAIRPARRIPWLLAALAAFLVSECGLAWPTSFSHRRMKLSAAALACLMMGSVPFEWAGQDAMRRGQTAFQNRDFALALRYFDEAQPLMADPTLAAFNRGSAYFRLDRFAEAARAYRLVVDDPTCPPERRERAWFDLGNSLLAQAGVKDRRLLEGAIGAYKECLKIEPEASLKCNAQYNLELAGRRLLKIQPEEPPQGSDPNPEEKPGKSPDKNSKNPTTPPSKKDSPRKTGSNDAPLDGSDSETKAPALGQITSLPDDAIPTAMSPEQAAATLAAQVERISRERRRDRQTRDVPSPHGKDW